MYVSYIIVIIIGIIMIIIIIIISAPLSIATLVQGIVSSATLVQGTFFTSWRQAHATPGKAVSMHIMLLRKSQILLWR